MSSLHERIKQCRIKKGFTQDQLAEKLGYTDRSSIAKIEKGLVDLTQSKIVAFANALGVTTLYLLSGEGEKSNEFRQAVRFEIEQAGDIDAAIENGLDIAFLEKIIEESGTLSLDDACRAADELGKTVSELLNEKDLRVFSTMDPQVKEIMEKLLDLSEEKREKALDYIRYLSTSPSI